MTIADQLRFLLAGGAVKRFHSVSIIKENTVAHHSFGVAWLAYLLSEHVPRVELIMAALAHDLAEQEIGDVPSPTKRNLGIVTLLERLEGEFRNRYEARFVLTKEEQHIVDLADRLDGMLFCVHERALGNRHVELPYQRWATYIGDMKLTRHQMDVFNAVQQLWEEVYVR